MYVLDAQIFAILFGTNPKDDKSWSGFFRNLVIDREAAIGALKALAEGGNGKFYEEKNFRSLKERFHRIANLLVKQDPALGIVSKWR